MHAFNNAEVDAMPSFSAIPARPAARPASHGVLLIATLALAAAFVWHGPIPQWVQYHAFADTRPWFGVPNAANVLSNLPFAAIGAWALLALPRTRATAAWRAFSVALIATAAGSALYHWAPGNAPLVADRLPIAWACGALLCAFLAERVDGRWESMPALLATTVAASASVAWWWLTEQHGHGDLRAYLFVQFLPMLLVATALALKLPARKPAAVPNRAWWAALGLYATAKALEVADHAVLDTLGFMSGHTLKHLLAAAAGLCLVRAVVRAGAGGRAGGGAVVRSAGRTSATGARQLR